MNASSCPADQQEQGRRLMERAMDDHAETERRLVARLSTQEPRDAADALGKMMLGRF